MCYAAFIMQFSATAASFIYYFRAAPLFLIIKPLFISSQPLPRYMLYFFVALGTKYRRVLSPMSLPRFRLLFVAAPVFTVKPLFFSSQPLPRL